MCDVSVGVDGGESGGGCVYCEDWYARIVVGVRVGVYDARFVEGEFFGIC